MPCVQVSHHNHGKHTLEVGVEVIKHQRKLRMQSFNNYRKRFGLPAYTSFEEMTGECIVYGRLDMCSLIPNFVAYL